jgi:serine protease Do
MRSSCLVSCTLGWTCLLLVALGDCSAVVASDPRLQLLEQQAFRAAVEKVAPAVVQLHVIGGSERVEELSLGDGPATGVILSPDGFVVTSLYRFDPPPTTVVARLADGRQFAATTVASDFNRKLVLLKLAEAEGLPHAKVASYQSVRVGAWAIAIGRVFDAERPYVTVGIISARNRLHGRAVQTDAAISAANYGGPLIDLQGRVVGIIAPMSPGSESAIAGTDWYDSGIGFAVPLETWLPIAERMKQKGNLRRGTMGVGLARGSEHTTPPKVAYCAPGGPAEEAGLKAGDLLESIDDKPVGNITDVKFALLPRYAGEELKIVYRRGDEQQETTLTLTEPSAPATGDDEESTDAASPQ